MKKIILTTLLLSLSYIGTTQTITEQNKIVASDRYIDDEFGYSAAISGNYAVVGAHHEDEDENGLNTVSNCGSAYIYEKGLNGNWVEVQKIVASDRSGYDRYGFSSTISNDYIAIGAWNIDANEGAVYIYHRNSSGLWIETQKLAAPSRRFAAHYGYSVSMDNNYLIVGEEADSYDENELNQLAESGSAFIYELDGSGNWNLIQKIVASDRASQDYFGRSVSITKEGYAVIGAYWSDTDENSSNAISKAGAAYIFERNISGNWIEVQKITAIDRAVNLWWGSSIEIDSNTIVVGTREDMQGVNGSQSHAAGGSATIFERNISGTWSFTQKLISNDRRSSDRFGTSISLDSGNLLIGAPTSSLDLNSGNHVLASGAVYLFNKDINGSWTQIQKTIASDRGTSDDRFGFSVSISGENSIVSAYKQDTDENSGNISSNAGAAYIFNSCISSSTITETSCDSYTSPSTEYTWNITGTYFDTIQNHRGCDSIMTINLTIINSTNSTDIQTACDSYTWIDGNTYTSNNNSATYTITNTAGCDSIITLDLTITNSTTSTDIQSACGSYTWIDGNTYTSNNNSATYTTTNTAGCDSIITLNLTINNSTTSTDIQSACGSYTWIDGNTYTSNNNSATFTTTNTEGCDSIITLDLTINNSTTSTDSQSACGSYTWIDGNTYTSNNNSATYTTTNTAGCDSIITLDLTIHTVDTSVTQNNFTLTSNTTGAQYQWIECDNFTDLIGETNMSFTPTSSGSYAVEITSSEGCVDTSSCYSAINTTIKEMNNEAKIFPQPFQNEINITLSEEGNRVMTLFDINGKKLYTINSISKNVKLNTLELTEGIYILNIINNNSTNNYTIVKH